MNIEQTVSYECILERLMGDQRSLAIEHSLTTLFNTKFEGAETSPLKQIRKKSDGWIHLLPICSHEVSAKLSDI